MAQDVSERRAAGASYRELAPYAWMLAGCFCLACMNQLAYQLRATCDWRRDGGGVPPRPEGRG